MHSLFYLKVPFIVHLCILIHNILPTCTDTISPIIHLFFFSTGLKDTAFFAALDESRFSIGIPAVIVWKDIKYNNGGHYSPATGAYTAPLAGYYQFSIEKTSNTYGSYSGSHFHLLIDGNRFTRHCTDDAAGQQQTRSTITVKLDQGSIVQVENIGTNSLYGFGQGSGLGSWFSGHLLFPA